MKRISYYIAAIVVAGIAVVGFWAYQKYFKSTSANYLSFTVSRGDIQETVKVRGVVVPQTEFDLAFPFGGKVSDVFVSEGQTVAANAPLMQLDVTDLQIQKNQQSSILAAERATLSKLLSGATPADISVTQAQVASAERSLEDADASLLDAMNVAYMQSDDAVHSKADKMFTNPTGSLPTFNPFVPNSQLVANIQTDRSVLENLFQAWSTMLSTTTQSSVQSNAEDTVTRLITVKKFLDDAALGVDTALPTASITQATLDGWKTDIATARTNVSTAMTAVVAAQEKVADADSALAVVKSQLALKTSAPRPEDIAIAESQVDQSVSQIAAIDEQLRRSVIRAPGEGIVKKLLLKKFEIATAGVSAVSFSTTGQKMQADITELSIGSVHLGDTHNATIRFDAFPEQTFTGTVVSVEPQEIIKDGDVYYRTNISIDKATAEIRSGMNADIVILGEKHAQVLMVPEIAVYKRGGASFVRVAPSGTSPQSISPQTLREQQITTGISDGESVEVLSGLSGGETVVVSSQ